MVPVPGSDELLEGDTVKEGVVDTGLVPVPGSDELPEGYIVGGAVVEVGAVPVPGKLKFNPGDSDEDRDSMGIGAVG